MAGRIKGLWGLTVWLLSAGNLYALDGAWRGELALGQVKLPLVFHFSQTAAGETLCVMDSPSQGAKGIAAEVQLCTADSLSLTCHVIGASYCGKITSGCIKGQFRQGGHAFPLDLFPDSPLETRRPQTPKPPFPYRAIDTTFVAPDGAVMSATLTLPFDAHGRNVPAVVMVTGSGPQNRDEELFEHKPFAVIADYLARRGIASLRYDDRGTGRSGGHFLTATTLTLKDDAVSGVGFLRSVAGIGQVGVLGHSEGGTIALLIGAENKADFILSLAGMAVSGKETLMRQNRHGLDGLQLSENDKESSLKLIESVFDTIAGQARQGVSTPVDINTLVARSGGRVPPQIVQSLLMMQQTRTPWFDTFLTLNPQEVLDKVKCPVLAVNGEKDTQVYPDNLEVIRRWVPQAVVKRMPDLNHLLQHAVTGEVMEYQEIRETISPEVLDLLAEFVRSVCRDAN